MQNSFTLLHITSLPADSNFWSVITLNISLLVGKLAIVAFAILFSFNIMVKSPSFTSIAIPVN